MPNPSMRDARDAAAAKPATPAPVFTTDSNGVRHGDRPKVGPADPATIHAALQAQQNLAKAPRPTPPVAESQVGATPAGDSDDNPTRDLRVTTAANRLSTYGAKLDQAIDDQSQ